MNHAMNHAMNEDQGSVDYRMTDTEQLAKELNQIVKRKIRQDAADPSKYRLEWEQLDGPQKDDMRDLARRLLERFDLVPKHRGRPETVTEAARKGFNS